ncbi:cytochrome c biogenesis fn [Trifolium pratense]|uniref:Cytochrome c biogenesis fn n=1 Tax=Trifolium pratense TaxID=57577 RepID=A0A2K3LWM0_TRIPR|nr:cytochrome c biogenesis fn [Trifolium pratense]
MNVKPLQPILHTNHPPLTVLALSQGWASLDAPTPNKLLVGIVKLSLFGHKDNSSYLISAAHLFRVQGRRGVLTRPPNPAEQVRGGPAIGSNPATFLVDHPVVTG